jgi:ABC-type multidrug transport system fused ATPase/permease subunit
MDLSLREMMQRASPFPRGRRNRVDAPAVPRQSRSVVSYYVAELPRVLRGPGAVLGFVVASMLHAVGHALVALVAGAIAISLAQRWGLRGTETYDFGGGSSLSDRAFLLAFAGLAVISVKGVAGVYATFVQARTAAEVGSGLRLKLLDALLDAHRMRQPRHEDQGGGAAPTARAVATLTDRVREFEGGLGQGLLGGARAAAQLVPLAALLIALSARMALVAAVILGGFGWGLERARAGYRTATKRAAHERERLLEAADEAARHADLWVTYGAEAKARETVRSLGCALTSRSARLEARSAAMSSANEILGAAALVVAMAASRAGWLGKIVDGTTLLAFAVAFFLAYRPMRELADARLAIARAQIAYDDLNGVLQASIATAATEEAGATPSAPSRPWPLAALEVRSLRLVHGVCEPVSLRVEPGTVAVVMGPTGVGKTTLLRTLLGLERAEGGEILFDGQPLGDAPAGPRARPFAWVPQDAPLLADTLTANVALAASDAEAYASLDPLGAAHLAHALEDARLGAGGRVVSGGERQWIALARAIATQQPVLLLDEPTTGLDPDSERRVLDAIDRLRGHRTVLLVTHRPEPLEIADMVVRLNVDPAHRRRG